MDLLQYTFFQHALLGSLLASIACGIIGTYIVTRRLVFISGGITHASFGGIGLGLYTGLSPILSAAVFSVLSAFGVEWLSKRKDMREDSAIAMFWTLGMALGIMFSFLSPGFAPDLSAYLFGNILTITQTDLLMLGILAILLILFFTLFIHPIIYIAFDREFARSQGIPVVVLEYILMMFIALTIVSCLRMVGIVLAISLLTIPQMTANLFFKRYYRLRGLEKRYSSGFETDALAYWYADAGTVKVQAGGGMSFRFGYNLGNTSPENSIRGATSAAPPFVYNRTNVANWGYYGYLHAAVRAVAHDLYLDGTVFRSSPEYVNKYPVVGEWGYGFGLRYKRTELLFGLHYITKEYTQQESMQCVGVLQLKHTF